MAYVSTVDYGETYITVDISGLSQAQNKYGGFRFRINGGSWMSVGVQAGYTGFDSPNYTFSGLTCGNSYYVEGEAYTNAWYPADAKWASTASCPPPPPDTTPPNLYFSEPTGTAITGSSIYAYASASDNKELSYFQFFLDGVVKSTQYFSGTSASAQYTFDGLKGNTYYTVKVTVADASGNSTSASYTVKTKANRPLDFVWDSSKISGSNVNISATEWNRLQDKINEFRKFKNLSEFSIFTGYNGDNSFTRAVYNSSIMAYFFNQCRNGINGMNPPTSAPYLVGSGSNINASDINRLRDSLNSIT